MPITVIESMVSNAERRAMLTGEEEIVPRISDIYAAIPSMTGKMELEYEGEQIGANRIAKDLIKRAAGEIFEGYFVGIDFAQTVQWFEQGNNLRLADTASAEECRTLLEAVPELIDTALIPFDFKKSDTGAAGGGLRVCARRSLRSEQDQPQRRRRLHGGDESEEGSPRDDLR